MVSRGVADIATEGESMEATTKAKTAAKQNGASATSPATATQKRLTELRTLAATDPTAAQTQTWQWFQDAGRRIAAEREAAIGELDELFNAGTPSEGIDGQTEGILVGFT